MSKCDKCGGPKELKNVELTRAEYLTKEKQEEVGMTEGMVAIETWYYPCTCYDKKEPEVKMDYSLFK